jgi:DegV family protein with EDD domain
MEEYNIGIVADEAVDLPEELIKNNDITLVRFKIELQELEKFPGNIYEKMRAADKQGAISFVKTSQPSINDFAKVFNEKLQKYKEIICFTISSKVSGTYNSAVQAQKFLSAELRERVHVFDTLNGSASEGVIALKAIEFLKKGMKLKEIVENLNAELKNIKLLGIYENGKWLEASGRLPRFVNKGAERIGIKPIFGFKDGKLTIVGIKRIKEAADVLFEEFKKKIQPNKPILVGITHADNKEQANKLKELLLKININVAFSSLVCVPIGGHIGPGTLVLAWDQ